MNLFDYLLAFCKNFIYHCDDVPSILVFDDFIESLQNQDIIRARLVSILKFKSNMVIIQKQKTRLLKELGTLSGSEYMSERKHYIEQFQILETQYNNNLKNLSRTLYLLEQVLEEER